MMVVVVVQGINRGLHVIFALGPLRRLSIYHNYSFVFSFCRVQLLFSITLQKEHLPEMTEVILQRNEKKLFSSFRI